MDLPRLTDSLDELVPAMLLPTLAAALRGDVTIVRLRPSADRLSMAFVSTSPIDRAALDECFDRLRGLYDGAERTSVETDSAGRTLIELDLPRKHDDSATQTELYDLASA